MWGKYVWICDVSEMRHADRGEQPLAARGPEFICSCMARQKHREQSLDSEHPFGTSLALSNFQFAYNHPHLVRQEDGWVCENELPTR